MLDSLSLWLHETPLGETLLTMLISMLPVVELRGGLPAGVAIFLGVVIAGCIITLLTHGVTLLF